jgi:hypothetical protein
MTSAEGGEVNVVTWPEVTLRIRSRIWVLPDGEPVRGALGHITELVDA